MFERPSRTIQDHSLGPQLAYNQCMHKIENIEKGHHIGDTSIAPLDRIGGVLLHL